MSTPTPCPLAEGIRQVRDTLAVMAYNPTPSVMVLRDLRDILNQIAHEVAALEIEAKSKREES